jgi:hypothetical protein
MLRDMVQPSRSDESLIGDRGKVPGRTRPSFDRIWASPCDFKAISRQIIKAGFTMSVPADN